MLKPFLLRLNLQHFAEPAAPTDPPAAGGNPTDPPVIPAPTDPPAKTFTQEELNAIAAKEAKSAQEKLLKQLGVTDFNGAKDGLAKFKEWQESQKSDQEKLADSLKDYETKYTTVTQEKEALEAKFAAVTNGVHTDFMDDVVTLAKSQVNEQTDINQAIKNVVEKYPHFKGQAAEPSTPPGPTFTSGQHQLQTPNGEPKSLAEAIAQSMAKK